MTKNFTKADVREMHRLYKEELWPLKAVGEAYGISRETVRRLFADHKLPTRPRGSNASTVALKNLRKAEERHERIIEVYKQLGNVDQVAAEVGVPVIYVSQIVAAIDARDSYRRRGHGQVYSNEDLSEALRTAADHLGEPLSVFAYQKAARSLRLPAHQTIIKRFGTWAKACKQANVKASKSVGGRKSTLTCEQCVEALKRCADQLGYEPTYGQYEAWAAGHKDRPSGASVKLRCGRWSDAQRLAFAD